MTVKYTGKVDIDRRTTTIEGFDEIVEKLREQGTVKPAASMAYIEFEVEADDLWDLYERMDEVEVNLNSMGQNYQISKEAVSDV
jgi:hypothetical protein